MPVLSARAVQLPASPIRRLAPLISAATQRGLHVYPLNIGQPDLPLAQPLRNAAHNLDLAHLDYTPSDGEPATRQALATFLAGRGFDTNPADLIVTNGGSEALLLTFMCVCDPGDEIICPEPLYANYVTLARLAGVTIRGVATDAQGGFRLPSLEALRAAVTPRTRAILWSSPANPTGVVYTLDELRRLCTLAEERDLYLVADEVYGDFFFGATRAPSLRDLPLEVARPDRVVVVDSASKRWAACGARLGWFYSRNTLLRAAVMKAAMGRLSPPMISERIIQTVNTLPASYYQGIQQEYQRRRDAVLQGLAGIDGAHAGEPQGAFYVFAELPVGNSDRFCEFMLEEFSHQGQTVAMAPGSGFYAQPPSPCASVRLAYVVEVPQLHKAMDVLAHGVAAWQRKQA